MARVGGASGRRAACCLAFAALLAFAAVAAASARTIPVKWTDAQPLGGGRVVYRTTKIWIHGALFSVNVSVTNETKYALRFFPATGPDDPAYIPRPGFGLAWREAASKNIHTRRLRTVVPRRFSHSFPTKPLGVGKTLSLTFSGRSRLLRSHREWWVTFGLAIPWQGKHPVPNANNGLGYWISDKTFST